ncbi:zinc ABC transporter substrate-binding protein [Paenibacillus sp. J22TS3]|nr:metal ABC transporter substrate-binding protein [Paenibacillus sp. J22TS3]GIP21313.1 zinc ABC transporter substrate-binding protein [Paenibacillus sp. J22TS3]
MKRRKRLAYMMSLSLVIILAACGGKGGTDTGNKEAGATSTTSPKISTEPANKLKIQTSFYPMYEFTKNVAGDLADVELLIPSTIEPHDWEPTPQDIKKIEEADLLVYNGAGMESWTEQVLGSISNSQLIPVEASQGIQLSEGKDEHNHDHEHDHNHEHNHKEDAHTHEGTDPHVWLSPALAIQEVHNIELALEKAAPEHKEEFKKNADAYIAKLKQLDNDFRTGLSQVKRKDFITQHAAFAYLAKEYGLDQVPIAGLSPDEEPSPAKMAEVVKFAKEHKVKTIFFETLVTSKVADTISKEIGAKSAVLNPLEGLTEEDQANHLDYIAVMRQNLEALKLALSE